PSLSICISTKSSKLIFSVDCTAALIVLVANSVVFSLAISIKVGRIPRSINHILKNIIQTKVIVVINKIYLIGEGLLFLKNLFFLYIYIIFETIYACFKKVRLLIISFMQSLIMLIFPLFPFSSHEF